VKVENFTIPRDGCTRYIRVITDEATRDDLHKLQRKFEFLMTIVTDGIYNGILSCGPVTFDKLNMEHNGVAWVIRLEAEVFSG
jgi:hypothetical protein